MGADFKTCSEMVCLRGLAATGKTEHLVRRAAQLLCSGVSAGQVRIVCASPSAAGEFRRRLAEELARDNNKCDELPCVTSARRLALDVLACEGAVRHFNRQARMLLPFEQNVLMEDVKTCGVPSKRLKEMLKFLYRSLTEMADDDPDWLYNEEEQDVWHTLERALASMRSYIEPEIANKAVKYLRLVRSGTLYVDAPTYQHVLVDDFTCLSAASQALCSFVAQDSLAVAGNRATSYEVFDSYPYVAGLDTFAALPQVQTNDLETCWRGAWSAHAMESYLSDAGLVERVSRVVGDCTPCLEFVDASTPSADLEAECEVATRTAQKKGTSSVFIASQSSAWRRSVVRALEKSGIATTSIADARRLSSDERDLTSCLGARQLCALELVADPQCSRAWRVWCGFGDYLLASRVFSELISAIEDTKAAVDYYVMLDRLSKDDGPVVSEDITRVLHAWVVGQEMVSNARGLSGDKLIAYIDRQICAESGSSTLQKGYTLGELCAPVLPEDGAAELLERAIEKLTFPAFDRDGVRVGRLCDLCGQTPETLVLSGFVNGSFPRASFFDPAAASIERRAKMRIEDSLLMANVVTKTRGQLVVGTYKYASARDAERLKPVVDRIGLLDGQPVAHVSKSVMADTLQQFWESEGVFVSGAIPLND